MTSGPDIHSPSGFVLHAAIGADLVIGADTFVGQNCTIMSKQRIDIGSRVAMAEYVSIRDHDHRLGRSPAYGGLTMSPVTIEDDVWLVATVLQRRAVASATERLLAPAA